MSDSIYTTLITPAQLMMEMDRPEVIIFDCRFDLMHPEAGEQAYQAQHIRSARYAHLDRDLSSTVTPETGRHPLPDQNDFIRWLEKQGVSNRSQIFCYDNSAGLFASRLWWLMRWVGHQAVAVVEGGLDACIAAGISVDAESPSLKPTKFSAGESLERYFSVAEIEAFVSSGERTLVDVRAAMRYRGEVEPIDPVAGHLPGTLNVPMDRTITADQKFLDPAELRKLYLEETNLFAKGEPIFMCGSGITACHSRLAVAYAGLPDAAIYPGSWSEWIRDPGRPVEKG